MVVRAKEKLRVFVKLGFECLQLGVKDFSPHVLIDIDVARNGRLRLDDSGSLGDLALGPLD